MIDPDWTAIWRLATEGFALGEHSIHGPGHWRAVERNAIDLAATSGADLTVVRLFAVLHDSKRKNENTDREHGPRAAAWAAELRGKYFVLGDQQFDLLTSACEGHDRGMTSDDPTIGTCWDADRLELPRVGVVPDPRFFSTAEGRRRVQLGWPFVR